MRYTHFISLSTFFLCICSITACFRSVTSHSIDCNEHFFINQRLDTILAVFYTEATWRKILSPEEFRILRKKENEKPFSGDLLHQKNVGLYTCRACGMPLFASKHKFEDASGWLSFRNVLDSTTICLGQELNPSIHGKSLSCRKCKSHLGHWFKDSSSSSNLRYSVNSAALDFVKEEN